MQRIVTCDFPPKKPSICLYTIHNLLLQSAPKLVFDCSKSDPKPKYLCFKNCSKLQLLSSTPVVNKLPPRRVLNIPFWLGYGLGKRIPRCSCSSKNLWGRLTAHTHFSGHTRAACMCRNHVLCVSVDAPARAAVQNMVTFNGYFGCTWCLIRGEHREAE